MVCSEPLGPAAYRGEWALKDTLCSQIDRSGRPAPRSIIGVEGRGHEHDLSLDSPPRPSRTRVGAVIRRRSTAPRFAAILTLVVVLGTFDATGKSIWFDEGMRVAVAKMPWATFVHTVGADEANMSLYYLLLRPWIALGGSGEAWIRFLSVIFAVGTVAVLYTLARRLFGFRVAIIAALLTATNGFFVQFSQEARSYMLVTLLVTIATYAFVRGMMEEPGIGWWILYACAVSLAVYGHFFAVFFPLAHVCSLPFLSRDRRRWRPLLATSLAVSVVLVIPTLRVAWLRRGTQIWWHPPVTPRQIVTVFAAASGGGRSTARAGHRDPRGARHRRRDWRVAAPRRE